ncbi:MAG: hypothetical protein V4574_08040 [Pseudomonadota bacterium]
MVKAGRAWIDGLFEGGSAVADLSGRAVAQAVYSGGSGNDTYAGTPDADDISGNGGNDTLAGGAGGDTINGNDGDDTLYSAAISPAWDRTRSTGVATPPVLDTGSEVDTLNGGAGVFDTIYAGYGDNIDGGAGAASLLIGFQGASSGVTVDFRGLASNGTLVVGGGTIANIRQVLWVDGSNFDDTINGGSIGSYSPDMRGLGGNDTLIAGFYTSGIYGGEGNDVIDGRAAGNTSYYYGEAGEDTIYLDTVSNSRADGGEGNDMFYGSGRFYGGAGNDSFNLTGSNASNAYGDDGDDTINGGGSADTLLGGAGADIVNGGNGNNRLYSAGVVINTQLIDEVDRGAEHDRLTGGTGLDFLAAGYGDDADGGIGSDTLVLSLIGATAGVTFDSNGIGTAGGVTLGGGRISNIETIQRIYGSAFGDTILLHDQGATVRVDGGEGDDHLTSSGTSALFHGDAGNDVLTGSSAHDTLYGGADADAIFGEGGDDAIFIEAGDVTAGETIDGGEGVDSVTVYTVYAPGYADITGVTFSNVETLNAGQIKLTLAQLGSFTTLQTGGILLATGGSLSLAGVTIGEYSNRRIAFSDAATTFDMTGALPAIPGQGYEITGGAGADVITTLGGNDTLNGGGGNDRLDGGAGADAMTGGLGDDVFVVDNTGDTAFEAGGQGIDIVTASVSWAMAAGQEIERLSTTNAAGTGAINLTGNDLANKIAGNDGANSLYGLGANDTLSGGGGDDLLDGGAGADAMTGGAGSDSYIVDNAGDTVFEAGSGGADTDTVTAYASWTLGAGQEVERLRAGPGADPINLTGNELAQKIQGNDGANILIAGGGNDVIIAGGGADTLYGGLGFDKLTGGTGADSFVIEAASGTDMITDFATGSDRIDLTALGFDWQDVQDAMSQNDGNTILNLGGGNSLIISDVANAALHESDFVLAALDPDGSAVPFGLLDDDMWDGGALRVAHDAGFDWHLI